MSYTLPAETAYTVMLPLNARKEVGHVWENEPEHGLWKGYSYAFEGFCGPFGTRGDAEAEVVDMWERSFGMTMYQWR